MIVSLENFHIQIADGIVALIIDNVQQRSNLRELVCNELQQCLHFLQFRIRSNLALQQHHEFTCRRSTNHHVTEHTLLTTQIEEGIIADCITDLIRDIILQPALLNGKHLIESSRDMESHSIHLIILHVLLYFLLGQPALVREGKLQLVPVELCFRGT